MEKGKSTMQGAIERLMSKTPQVEVTKLPEKEPEYNPRKGFPADAEWPKHLSVNDKKYPWLTNCKAGDEVYLIVKAKVGEIVTVQDEKGKESKSSELTLLEVGRFSGL